MELESCYTSVESPKLLSKRSLGARKECSDSYVKKRLQCDEKQNDSLRPSNIRCFRNDLSTTLPELEEVDEPEEGECKYSPMIFIDALVPVKFHSIAKRRKLPLVKFENPKEIAYYGPRQFFVGASYVRAKVDTYAKWRKCQSKDLIVVLGAPRSGKTTLARQMIPEYLSNSNCNHLWERDVSDNVLCTYYFNMKETNHSNDRIAGFYKMLCKALYVKEENFENYEFPIMELCRNASKQTKMVITLDEYQDLFFGLDVNEVHRIAQCFKVLFTDPSSNIQWIVTGSTDAVLVYLLIKHGTSLFNLPTIFQTGISDLIPQSHIQINFLR